MRAKCALWTIWMQVSTLKTLYASSRNPVFKTWVRAWGVWQHRIFIISSNLEKTENSHFRFAFIDNRKRLQLLNWFKLSTHVSVKLILSISSHWLLKVVNASAAVTLLEQRPEKIQAPRGFEPTTYAMPVQCSRNSELWKPHQRGRMRISPHWHRRGRGFGSRSEPEFF